MSGEQFLYGRPTFPAQLDMSHPLTRGLVGCWVLNEEGGMRAFDSSPYQNHGTVTGAKGHYDGRTFAGAEFIKNSTANWRSGDSLGSISAWFKTSSATAQVLFASCDEATANSQFVYGVDASGKLWVAHVEAAVVTADISGSTSLGDGVWHFGTLNSSGTAYSMIVDGVSQTLTINTGTNNGNWLADTSNRDNFSIGARIRSTTISYMVGTIGGVFVHSRPLIALEHKSLYLNPWEMFIR